jgi:hypothetical protein
MGGQKIILWGHLPPLDPPWRRHWSCMSLPLTMELVYLMTYACMNNTQFVMRRTGYLFIVVLNVFKHIF